MSTWFSTAAVLPQLQDRLGLTTTTTSFVLVAVQIGFVAGAFISAITNLADRLNPRHLLAIGCVGASIANALILTTDSMATVLLYRFLVGVMLAWVYPPALKAMSSWFINNRGLALGFMVGAITLGTALPHLLRSFGSPQWELVILATSAFSLAAGGIARFVCADGPHSFPKATFDPQQIRAVFSNKKMVLATVGYLGHMWELYALWAWIAVFAGDAFPNAPENAARFAFGVVAVGSVGCLAGGLLSDRFSRTTAAGLSLAISGTMAAVAGFLIHQPLLLLPVCLIWGFWAIADSAQFSTIVTEVGDQRYVGTALTLQIALGYLLTVVTIYLVPIIRDASNWGWAFLVLTPGAAIGALAMQKLHRSE